MRKFVRVLNKIKSITSKDVEFWNPFVDNKFSTQGSYTFLNRLHSGNVIWKLMPDGIYVRREFVEAYSLMADDTKEILNANPRLKKALAEMQE